MVSRWPPTELFEGYNIEAVRENYVITDGTRIMQMYYVHPLQHAEGMLMAYLPKEKLVDRGGSVRHARAAAVGADARAHRASTTRCGR